MTLERWGWLWIVFLSAGLVATARAQTGEAAADGVAQAPLNAELLEQYRSEVEIGFEEFNAGNLPEALARFSKAHELSPSARTFRSMGMAEARLRYYLSALEHLEQALNDPRRPLNGVERGETERDIAELEQRYVATYRLELEPSNLEISVDGRPMQLGPERALRLQLGSYQLKAYAPGYLDHQGDLLVTRGGEATLPLHLTPLAPSAEPTQVPSPPKDEPGITSQWWFWTALGVLVAGGATAGAVALANGSDSGSNLNTGTTGMLIKVPSAP